MNYIHKKHIQTYLNHIYPDLSDKIKLAANDKNFNGIELGDAHTALAGGEQKPATITPPKPVYDVEPIDPLAKKPITI